VVGKLTREGFQALKDIGVSVVVDLHVTGRDQERKPVTALGMRYVEMPWECFHPEDKDIAKVLTLLGETKTQKVFVHCYTGDDRTGMEIAAYRMAEQGWTAQRARKEMDASGFDLRHRRVCPGLGAYETHFPKRYQSNSAFLGLRSTESSQQP
jgi:hypothetical protein